MSELGRIALLLAGLLANSPAAGASLPSDSGDTIPVASQQEIQAQPTSTRALSETLAESQADFQRTQSLQNLVQLGKDAYRSGEIELAGSRWLAALERAEAEKDQVIEVEVLWRLATLERRRANFYEALSYQLRVLNLIRTRPELGKIWKVQSEIAVLFEQLELPEQARNNNIDAVESAKQAGTLLDIASAQIQFAGFLNDFGVQDSETTRLLIESALPIIKGEGTLAQLSSAMLQSGRNQFNLSNLVGAQSDYETALALARQVGSSALVAHIQFRQGELALIQGNGKAALAKVMQAQSGYEQQRNRPRLIKVHAMLERIHNALGDDLAAARAGREHYRMRNEVLGGKATLRFEQRLDALILSEERASNAALKSLNNAASIRLRYQQRLFVVIVGGVIILSALFYILLRRHRLMQSLNRDLTQAHETLKAKSAELYHASITDPLTGVFNRRYGLSTLDAMLLDRGGRPLSVSMIDLDHFKNINDRYGHPVGDEVLRSVAQTIMNTLPSDAVVARFGGEEFLLLLPGRTSEESALLLSQARLNVAKKTVWTQDGALQVSMSIGERFVSADEPTPAVQILSDADFALYSAKQRGRNAVVRWGDVARTV
jgi:diguanylate cyclase (GGDEF)-like protein